MYVKSIFHMKTKCLSKLSLRKMVFLIIIMPCNSDLTIWIYSFARTNPKRYGFYYVFVYMLGVYVAIETSQVYVTRISHTTHSHTCHRETNESIHIMFCINTNAKWYHYYYPRLKGKLEKRAHINGTMALGLESKNIILKNPTVFF